MTLSDHQLEQLHLATSRGRIGILAGGPGTGKSYSAAHYVRQHMSGGMGHHIAACAPTGKAAVRLTESFAAADVRLSARTIHSLLGVVGTDGTDWEFEYNETNPLPWTLLVVDEASMIDTDRMADLLLAIPANGRVLFLGDTDQLSPVGHGAPLRDLIAAGVPTGELTEVRRNAGRIVEACHAMRTGQPWEPGGNLLHQPIADETDLVNQFTAAMRANGLGVDDCQIVVPTNDLRERLNLELQKQCNPKADRPGELCENDKVINTKNGWLARSGPVSDEAIVNDNDQVYVANGEMGRVLYCNPKSVVIELPLPLRTVRVPLGDDGCKWQLAYGITTHKAQGSEFRVVFVVLHESAIRMCDRSWLYTSISRAKDCCVLAGELELAYAMCRKNRIDDRKTFLRQLIEAK